ncbi:MAG TPA: M3 family oligoendopeptidase [Clostridiales bacterium]|nr:M3 family oligoendopeptidase [Clostridiales bacterium]
MNNEELILQMLTELKNGVTELKNDVTELKSDVTELKSDVTELKSDVTELKSDMSDVKKTINDIDERTTRIELHLENVTDKNVLLLMEQHGLITDNVKEGQEKINTLIFDVDNLKRVAISHSKDINKLMGVK